MTTHPDVLDETTTDITADVTTDVTGLGGAPPGEWVEQALCAQVDPEVWFPELGSSPVAARRICGRCDVAGDCLAYAMTHRIPYGVWGGLTARERQELRRARRPEVDR